MVADTLPLSRDLKLGKVAIDKATLVKVRGSVSLPKETFSVTVSRVRLLKTTGTLCSQ